MVALPPSGPFPNSSVKRWFHWAEGHRRLFNLDDYVDAMVAEGTSSVVAMDIRGRLAQYGATRVAWAMAYGGRRGHFRKVWDIRLVEPLSNANEAVREVVGASPTRPLGVEPIESLLSDDRVAVAQIGEASPSEIRLEGRRIFNRIRTHYTRYGLAALAAGEVGATVAVASDAGAEVRPAIVSLAHKLLGERTDESGTSEV